MSPTSCQGIDNKICSNPQKCGLDSGTLLSELLTNGSAAFDVLRLDIFCTFVELERDLHLVLLERVKRWCQPKANVNERRSTHEHGLSSCVSLMPLYTFFFGIFSPSHTFLLVNIYTLVFKTFLSQYYRCDSILSSLHNTSLILPWMCSRTFDEPLKLGELLDGATRGPI